MLVITTELLNPAREDEYAIGAPFRLNLGIRGIPEFPSRIGLPKAV